MTRGTLFVIESLSENKDTARYRIVSSCEFNGDMYEGGLYEEAIGRLRDVENNADFYKEVLAFDADNFQYQDEGGNYFRFYCDVLDDELTDGRIDITKGCFEKCFSDYMYFKNIDDAEAVVFLTKDPQDVTVQPGEIVVFSGDQYYAHFNSEGEEIYHKPEDKEDYGNNI
jgi:hypothetical protein